ncbi:MAG: DUF268 domain-containing protein [Verrucomicrobia bacterium]|nr:DUF268 domain-containing protein [Verrucomicrobiota bacterium]
MPHVTSDSTPGAAACAEPSTATAQLSVSVVVPVARDDAAFRTTLQSVLAQDYAPLRCVVAERRRDAGTERIGDLDEEGVTRVASPGCTFEEAVCAGLAHTESDVVAWLAPGDIYLPGAVAAAAAYLCRHPDADAVYGDCGALVRGNNIVGTTAYRRSLDFGSSLEHGETGVPRSAAFVRRRAIEAFGPPRPTLIRNSGYELWLRLAKADRVHHLPRTLAASRPDVGGADGLVESLDRVLDDLDVTGIPEDVLRRARSNAYLEEALGAWRGGFRWQVALEASLRAVAQDPSNRHRVLARLGRLFQNNGALIRLCEQLDASTGRIALFGWTDVAEQLIAAFGDRDIVCIIDNDPVKQGWTVAGVPVLSIEEARRDPPDVIAITSITSREAIMAQIRSQFDLARTHIVPVDEVCQQLNATRGPIGLVGATPLARQLIRQFRHREMVFVIDEDAARRGERIEGLEAVSLEDAAFRPPEVLVLADPERRDEQLDAVTAHRGLCRCTLVPEIGNHHTTMRGDRDIEWSWVVGRMPLGPGKALDLGCGSTWLGLAAARRGYEVTAIDLNRAIWLYEHPDLHFVQGDLFDLPFESVGFDVTINCSTVEHIGLMGRFGSCERPDGDLEAMRRLWDLTKPGGVMLLTIPVGVDEVVIPVHRIYGRERLPRLLDGWEVAEEEYWVKDERNCWQSRTREDALDYQTQQNVYALGCFVLRRPAGGPEEAKGDI